MNQQTVHHPAGLPEDEPARRERQVQRRSSPSADTVHEVVRREGEQEMARASSALFASGLAAGLAMGLSLVVDGALRSVLPKEPWAQEGVARLGYAVGFIVVTLGRQQLFTESTLTAVLPALERRDARSLTQMLRVWAVVLAANLLGGLAIAWVAADTSAFGAEMKAAFAEIGRKAIEPSFGTVLLRGILAGWLIALIVWLMPASEGGAKFWVILLLGYAVGLLHLSHSIAGSVETMYLAWSGEIAWSKYAWQFLIPAVIGNTIGGVTLTAGLNYAQVRAGGEGGES